MRLACILAGATLAVLSLIGSVEAKSQDDSYPDEAARNGRAVEQEYRLNPELQRQIRIGLSITPVPLNTAGKSVALVGLGSYLVNAAGGCNDCHTNPPYAPDGNPFVGQPKKINAAGYLAGGTAFGPGIVSRNLTPENGLPAGRTYKEFVKIMRTGIDLDNAHPQIGPLLQVMPWPVYQSLTDRDLLAIYTYLSAIPAIAPTQ